MFRVIRSSIQNIDIDADQADDFEAAIDAAITRRDQVRETFSCDEIGQKAYHLALLPYTDPNGEHRWAIFDSGPTEYDCQDTDDLDEAITAYEEWVRGATAGAMPSYDEDGEELPLWDESDVEGISAKEVYDGDAGNDNARLIDAEWAHEEFTKAEESYQQATQRRQVAFAKMIDSRGRGGQAMLASRVNLKEPTVKTIADKGRALLAQARTADVKDAE
ncbi:hypothetical protein [Streptomyces sp. NPDC007991]|uniref:hypothetical protein n=1 Tax=Streptomyces sp. NPDC007991 TaxID=3364803 RepID=UPI0036EF9146